ncbi:MAG: hypothetical protein KGY76_02580 [Candidatus Thermoplasmatota archaeon]|nr:hypothetical protein [Candidatus Thermoplasmatota archaeon]
MRREIDDEGVIGFYEDVPALLIVVVGTLIFLASMYSAIERHDESSTHSEFEREAIEFAEGVRASERLLYKDRIGQFDASKVEGLNSENLTRSFNNPDFYYKVTLTDVSNYSVRYNKTWRKEPDSNFTEESYEKGRKVILLSVNIVVDSDEIHPARLRVEVWE